MRLGWIALALCACSPDKTPDSGPTGLDATLQSDSGEEDAALPEKDASVFVVHDGGGPIACNVTCDCPQGRACVDGECASLGTPVWCCEKAGCPRDQQCLAGNEKPNVCEGDPDPADGGMRGDASAGLIGDYCEQDQDCDTTQGFSCWERLQPPYLWGYCTRENCQSVADCPAGSDCLQFNDAPPLTGCMTTCNAEADCRSDAFCFPIPMAPFFGVCIPDCRDDVLDCTPRDGTVYCNPTNGLWLPSCDPTPSHNNSALIGDACVNSVDCAFGDVCLGEIGWGLDDGMCSHICDGTFEATPCPFGSTCQYLPQLPLPYQFGYCVRDCVGGACPDRANASCGSLDPSWTEPGCLPPILP